jgi:hypothetical protein
MARLPSLPVSQAPCTALPLGETFLVGTPLELTLDSDNEDYGNDRSKRFLLKPKIHDTRSKSASPMRSELVSWSDETDYLPLVPRFYRDRPRRRPLRRSLDCSAAAVAGRTVPLFPLETPENSKRVLQTVPLSSDAAAPIDLPMLPFPQKESPGLKGVGNMDDQKRPCAG